MDGFTVIIMQVSVQIGLNWYWTGTELGKNLENNFKILTLHKPWNVCTFFCLSRKKVEFDRVEIADSEW